MGKSLDQMTPAEKAETFRKFKRSVDRVGFVAGIAAIVCIFGAIWTAFMAQFIWSAIVCLVILIGSMFLIKGANALIEQEKAKDFQ